MKRGRGEGGRLKRDSSPDDFRTEGNVGRRKRIQERKVGAKGETSLSAMLSHLNTRPSQDYFATPCLAGGLEEDLPVI